MSIQTCRICMSKSEVLYFDIFEEGKSKNDVITKHLSVELKPSNVQQWICNECWNVLYEFNDFYEKIKKIHDEFDNDCSKTEEDPIGEDHFSDSSYVNPQSEFLEVVKLEPADEPEVEKGFQLEQDVFCEDTEVNEIKSKVATRKSSRNKQPVELTVPTDDSIVASDRRPQRNSTRRKYETDTVSEDECELSDELDATKSPKRRKSSEDFDKSSSESNDEPSSKPVRAKRKRDIKLFEHIDEFICYLCPNRVEFDRFYHATVHYKKYHKEPAYIKCKICDKRCYTPGNFISHVAVHVDPDKYKCQICGKQNDQQVALAKHMRIHRPELEEKLPLRCGKCPRRFATEKKRDRHEKHHNRKPMEKTPRIVGPDKELLEFYKRISCEICDQQKMIDDKLADVEYDNMQDLKKHMREAHNDKGYLKCHLCDKKCHIRSVLLIHKHFHLNPEKYRCKLCGNVYQNLQKHLEGSHGTAGEASYCCEHCGKALTSEKSLKSHVDRKHAAKDVVCDICHKHFSKNTLDSHKRVVHEAALFMCTHCPRMFKSKFSLNRHQEEHEDKVRERVKCTICGLTFKHKYILTKHIDSVHTTEAPVSCDVCGKMFKSKHHLWSHKSDTCNNRRYDCTICGRIFKVKVRLTEHMTTHTGKSLYQCTFCPLTFSFQSTLYTHRKKAHYEQWLELQAKREEGVKFKVLEAPA